MASIPRIITVDPTWTIARIVRGAMDLLDRSIIQIDVPTGTEALEELKRGGCSLVITDLELGYDMKGFEFALRASQISPETAIVILADVDDPEELDEETAENSPFVYLHRPVDMQQFARVLMAALEGKPMKEAMAVPLGAAATEINFGPVPLLDLQTAQSVIDTLLSDLGAMAIIFSTRAGEVLLGRGATGYVNNEKLSRALVPMVTTNMEFKELVGGQASTVQFYDGDTYDVFVLSVGMHHFMSIVFPGDNGSKQFGAVNRFGRRAAEDLIAMLGANAWLIQAQPPESSTRQPRKSRPIQVDEEPEVIQLAQAEFAGAARLEDEHPTSELEKLALAPVVDFDADKLFSLDFDVAQMENMFDLDKLGEIAEQSNKKQGSISFDQAEELGILKSSS